MSKVINTAGMTPFEVVVDGTVPATTRFVRALIRTNAKVANSQTHAKSQMKFLVWISPTMIATFEAFCVPLSFQFVSATVIRPDGTLDPAKAEAGKPRG